MRLLRLKVMSWADLGSMFKFFFRSENRSKCDDDDGGRRLITRSFSVCKSDLAHEFLSISQSVREHGKQKLNRRGSSTGIQRVHFKVTVVRKQWCERPSFYMRRLR